MAIDNVTVTITVQDTKVSQAGFGTILILEEHSVFGARTKSYASITEVAVDFASTTKVYKAANAIFSQNPAVPSIKVGRIDEGDTDVADSLDEIQLEDPDWYGLVSTNHEESHVEAVAAWVEANTKIFGSAVEYADIPTSATDDLASNLKSNSYDRTFLMWHHQPGPDLVGLSITVSSNTATVTATSHGLQVGDTFTVEGANGTNLNGLHTVATVPDTDTFTYTHGSEPDGADPNNGSIIAYLEYGYPEAAWFGKIFPYDPGVNTWKFKTLAGIQATPTTRLNSSQAALVKGKNANVYVTHAGVAVTSEGVMASGRFIDVQRGMDWLNARLEENIFSNLVNAQKIPYTNAGIALIENAIREVMGQALQKTVLSPLNDVEAYELTIPDVLDIPTADRQNRLFPDITFNARVGSAVHGVTVSGTIQV